MFNILVKLKNAYTFLLNTRILSRINSIQANTRPRTLLLIRLDAIGDYILFRNYIEAIKNSKKYKNYKITLCGNIIWKEAAEQFDKEFVDEFIWVDRKLFYSNASYRFSLLKQIKQHGFETVVDTAYSREILYGDTIVRASGAKVKIGSEGAGDKHVAWKRKVFSKDIYTDIIPAGKDDLFEFNRNREFVSKLINEEPVINNPFIDISDIETAHNPSVPYAVLFFGASTENKIWHINNFIETGRYLRDTYNLKLVITGGKQEKKNSVLFSSALGKEAVIDLCGNSTIPELAKIIAGGVLLISNESMATHLAASVNKQFICISNGERIGRFHPYPNGIFDKAFYIYPDEISKNLDNPEFLAKFRFGSDLDINSIPVERVKEMIKKIL